MSKTNQSTLYILYEEDHWDMPLSGLGRYQGQLVWFYCNDEFETDYITGERLSNQEAMRRLRLFESILDEYSDDQLDTPEIDQRIEDEVGSCPTTTRIYAIHQLLWFEKLAALYKKKMFELFVGQHWSWDKADLNNRRRSFRMNRWFGLGRLLFKIYFRKANKQKQWDKIDRYKNNPIIDYIRLEDCKFGKPTNE